MDLFKISPSIVLIALIHVTRAFAKGKLSYVEIKQYRSFLDFFLDFKKPNDLQQNSGQTMD